MDVNITDHWSDEVDVPVDFAVVWRIGPLHLMVRRARSFWQVHSELDAGHEVTMSREVAEIESFALLPELQWERHGFNDAPSTIRLRPLLADRHVVTRPEFPFRLPAGEKVTLYVTTPLWVEVRVGQARVPLADLPTWRLSDTWFGPVERGHLCYAASTSCKQDLETVRIKPNRAITPLEIVNMATTPVKLDRISLPVPNLCIYAAGGRLWTEGLTLVHDPQKGFTQARRAKGPPPEAGEAALLSPPREPQGESFMVTALASLLG